MTSTSSERVLLGCVAENNHKYLSQAVRLVQSVRWFGGSFSDADFIVCAVEGVESNYRRTLEGLAAEIRIVSRFDPANPLFNKIQLFRIRDVERYDTLLYLDCDTIVAQDPSPFLEPAVLQAKIAACQPYQPRHWSGCVVTMASSRLNDATGQLSIKCRRSGIATPALSLVRCNSYLG